MNQRLSIPTPGSMLKRWQEEYAAAFGENRLPEMLHNAQRLYRLYAALGNSMLARRWTDEYIRCWSLRNDPPSGEDNLPVDPPFAPEDAALTMLPGRMA
ncbi:MAG: hypothetical protein PHP44_15265 [Kiritimatiellae bacterium]|nr:hypothetical protein [Kiritimatiellia bacterium]MDD4737456.1 hypothetical protein [Kiritimatiellia bacterium]